MLYTLTQRQELECRRYKLKRSKIEYMKCTFSMNEITRGTIKSKDKKIALKQQRSSLKTLI